MTSKKPHHGLGSTQMKSVPALIVGASAAVLPLWHRGEGREPGLGLTTGTGP